MKLKKYILTSLALLFIMTGCKNASVNSHKQFNLLPENEILGLGIIYYSDFLIKNPPVPAIDPATKMVSRVGKRVVTAVEKYFSQSNAITKIADYKWEFNVVNDEAVNAWCLPGGKIVVYSGFLPLIHDESSLAWVLGHSIAHAITRHGNERMSQGLIKELGGMSLDLASTEKEKETEQIFMTTYGAANDIGLIVPFSRTHEAEADKLALAFMAMAGYNPKTAPVFLDKVLKAGNPKNQMEYLLSHPCDEQRITNMKTYLPVAMKFYKDYIILASKNAITPPPISTPAPN